MPAINPYLAFNGNCEEAFNFYKSVFGGELMLCRFKDAPPNTMPYTPDEANRVMHCSIDIGTTILMGSDTAPSCGPTATFGDNITINYCPDNGEDAKRIFAALSDGAKIAMPLEKVFWAELFGMLVDKFGVPWMVNYGNCEK